MGAGHPDNPFGTSPFRNVVNVSWPGRYIAFRWRCGSVRPSELIECFSPITDPNLFDWFEFAVEWRWLLREFEFMDGDTIHETRNGGKTWFSGDSKESYNFAGAPGTPIEGQSNRLVESIGIPDWTYLGTTQPGGDHNPPERVELIPNGSDTGVPIPDPGSPGKSHPTDRFLDATNLIFEVDLVRYTGSTDRCLPWTVPEGAPGLGHFVIRRELATGASPAPELTGQYDLSNVTATKDGKHYVAAGFRRISDIEFWCLLKHVGPAPA